MARDKDDSDLEQLPLFPVDRRVVDAYVEQLFRSVLDRGGTYTPSDLLAVRLAMIRLDWEKFPDWKHASREIFHRASGEAICRACQRAYRVHPLDWRCIEYEGRPYLHVLCNGELVKL